MMNSLSENLQKEDWGFWSPSLLYAKCITRLLNKENYKSLFPWSSRIAANHFLGSADLVQKGNIADQLGSKPALHFLSCDRRKTGQPLWVSHPLSVKQG